MHPLKSLNVMGDGGMVTTNNKKIFNWLRKFRNHGMTDRDHIQFWVQIETTTFSSNCSFNWIKKLSTVIKKIQTKLMDKMLSIISSRDFT